MKKYFILICLCVAAMAVKAQIPQPDPDTTARHFLTVASIDNLQEVSAAQQAVQKAKQSDVKNFGRMMVKDHGDAEQQLLVLAKSLNIQLAPATTGGVQQDINLEKASDDFDKLYVHAMVSGHRSAVAMFMNYATVGKNPEVRAFAQQMLPTLKAHLAAILAIEKQMN